MSYPCAATYPIGRYVFLGDYVGYGADPGFVVDTVEDFVRAWRRCVARQS